MSGGDLSMDKEGRAIAQVRRLVIKPIWNAYAFFTLYANADGSAGELVSEASAVLDRYVLAKSRELVEEVQARLDSYDIPGACAVVTRFVDAVNNWYIRRSRGRFWRSTKDRDKQDAYNTLYTVLITLCRVAAPLLPLTMEKIHTGLTGAASVHLSDWPDAEALPADPDLIDAMERVREVCSAGLAIREQHKLRVRLPLQRLIVVDGEAERLRPFVELVADEVNVKEVVLDSDLEAYGKLELAVNPKIGARIGKEMKPVLAAARAGEWEDLGDGTVAVAGQVLGPEDFTLRLKVADGAAAQGLSGRGAAVLDLTLTPTLEREGLARDLVRLIQSARKEADFHISDSIHLAIEAPSELAPAIEEFEDLIKSETLAVELSLGPAGEASHQGQHDVQGYKVTIGVTKAD